MFEHILGRLRTQFENQILYLLFKKEFFWGEGVNILMNNVENEAGTHYW